MVEENFAKFRKRQTPQRRAAAPSRAWLAVAASLACRGHDGRACTWVSFVTLQSLWKAAAVAIGSCTSLHTHMPTGRLAGTDAAAFNQGMPPPSGATPIITGRTIDAARSLFLSLSLAQTRPRHLHFWNLGRT